MNRQATRDFLELVLRHDLNDTLTAFALRTVLTEIISAVLNLVIQPEEGSFLKARNLALANLEGLLANEAEQAVRSEYANQGRKTPEKAYAARNDYSRAVAAIGEGLRDFIAVMERLENAGA